MQFVARGRGTVQLHRGLASSAAARSFDWNAHQVGDSARMPLTLRLGSRLFAPHLTSFLSLPLPNQSTVALAVAEEEDRGSGSFLLHVWLAAITHSQLAALPSPPCVGSSQSTIPRLPLPQLNETLERYIEAVTPLASPAELAQTRTAVAEFASNAGPRLQTILVSRSRPPVGMPPFALATDLDNHPYSFYFVLRRCLPLCLQN